MLSMVLPLSSMVTLILWSTTEGDDDADGALVLFIGADAEDVTGATARQVVKVLPIRAYP